MIKPNEGLNHDYLGNGVYIEITPYDIILRANDHRNFYCTDKIHLDEYVVEALLRVLKRKYKDGKFCYISPDEFQQDEKIANETHKK